VIGRFASSLQRHLPATLVAGVILTGIGAWFAWEPWRHDYPELGELVPFAGEPIDAREVHKRRGAVLRFLQHDTMELHIALDPGERVVLYLNSMPGYDVVRASVTEQLPATYYLWDDADDEMNRMLVWQFESEQGTMVSIDQTVGGLKAARAEAAWLPTGITIFGLALIGLGLRARARATADDA